MSVRNGNINIKWLHEFRVDNDARFMNEVYMHSLNNASASGGSYLVLDNAQVSTRSAAEVLSDIGALGSSATAAAASLLTHANQTLDSSCFVTFATAATGNLAASTNAAFTFDATDGTLGASSLETTGNITAVGTIHIDGTSGAAARLEISEDTDNGTNGVRINGPSSTSGYVLTLPASASAGLMSNDGAGALIFTKEFNRQFSVTGDTDGTYSGDVGYFGGTTSMTTGAIYHYKSDGTWELADADSASTCDGLLGVALGAASDTNGMLLRGMVTLDHDPGAVGDVLYLSTTAGDATSTIPSGNQDIVRVIGYCLHASNGQIWFNPDNTFVQISV
tara:strand:- start:2375 stop:3379 length:1005 start_codon:yes stop_codon:yes gene_type:complete